MIQAKELRIGNSVQYDETGAFATALEIDAGGMRVLFEDTEDTWIEHWAFSPIKVSREILARLGAKDFPDGESMILNNRLISYAECRKAYFDKASGVELKYVHQTQNLFFALTGEELKF